MDLIEFFDEYGIQTWTQGNNVGNGFINIQCPYCDDTSNHLGINLNNGFTRCWKCGRHHLRNTLMHVSGCSYAEASKVELPGNEAIAHTEGTTSLKKATSSVLKMSLPYESNFSFTKKHREWLRNEGFPPLKTIKRWRLKSVANEPGSKYEWRIIIPYYLNNNLVSFSGRTIGDDVKPKYRAGSPDEVIYTTKECVYNLDSIQEGGDAVAVEGPKDVWKIGDGSICYSGTEFTRRQIVLTKRKKIKRLFILMDNDKGGKRAAKIMARVLGPLVRQTEILTLQRHGDPGEMSQLDAEILKNDLQLNY